jgi:hypothetical protein
MSPGLNQRSSTGSSPATGKKREKEREGRERESKRRGRERK